MIPLPAFRHEYQFLDLELQVALVGSRGEQRSNGGFIGLPLALAKYMSNLPAVFVVEVSRWKRSIPPWKYGLPERFFRSRLFPVVWKDRLIARQKSPHQNQVAVVIHAHADHF